MNRRESHLLQGPLLPEPTGVSSTTPNPQGLNRIAQMPLGTTGRLATASAAAAAAAAKRSHSHSHPTHHYRWLGLFLFRFNRKRRFCILWAGLCAVWLTVLSRWRWSLLPERESVGTFGRSSSSSSSSSVSGGDRQPGSKPKYDRRAYLNGQRSNNHHASDVATATATANSTHGGGGGGIKIPSPVGQSIVETSYRTSGFSDLIDDFCPLDSASASARTIQRVTTSRLQRDFLDRCLSAAKRSGDTPGTKHHDRWPWWFRTLLRDSVLPRNGLAGPWHLLQFRDVSGSKNVSGSKSGKEASQQQQQQQQRLQLCVYEKGGTKHWKKLQCKHNFEQNGTEKMPNFNHCWNRQPPYDDNDSSTSAGASASARAVFLRDPLERFLSGFLDKCVRRLDVVDHCEPVSVFSRGTEQPTNATAITITTRTGTGTTTKTTTTTASSSKKINKNNGHHHDAQQQQQQQQRRSSPIDTMLWDKRRTFEAYVDTFPLTWNMHFLPQSFYCGGLYRTIGDYDFVGSMGETLYEDLSELESRYPGLAQGLESVFGLEKRKRKSASNKKVPARTGGIETGASEKVLEYYSPHTVRRVLEYYAVDYVALGLPIPGWAEELLQQPLSG